MPPVEPLVISRELTIAGDFLSVSYTRDLGAEGSPEVAKHTPTTVELRLDVTRCADLDPAARERVLAHPELRSDSRGTVRVRCDEFPSRRKNVAAARQRLAAILAEAIEAPDVATLRPSPLAEAPRRARAGLIKPGRGPG
jgi:ribosome-associated protein